MDPDASSVDDPQRRQAQLVRFFQISFHGLFHVARRYGVEVERIRDRDSDGIIHKLKRPDLDSPDRAPNNYYSAPNGLRDLSSPRAAHDRFHLIFQTEFHLLETMLLHLLLH